MRSRHGLHAVQPASAREPYHIDDVHARSALGRAGKPDWHDLSSLDARRLVTQIEKIETAPVDLLCLERTIGGDCDAVGVSRGAFAESSRAFRAASM